MSYLRDHSPSLAFCWVVLAVLSLFVVQCSKRGPSLPPPSAPAPPVSEPTSTDPGSQGAQLRPELDLRIEPVRISRGASALLTWQSRYADSVEIGPNIGSVDLSGRIKFFPERTTTYRVTARGPGGETSRSVKVEVGPDRPSGVSVEDVAGLSIADQFTEFVKPVFFAFDSADLSQEGRLTLDTNIKWLSRPEYNYLPFVLEGHTDERGSEEYNLALGDMRAQVVRTYLVANGIDSSRIKTVTMGEERPFDRSKTEEAYALNRRTHFRLVDTP